MKGRYVYFKSESSTMTTRITIVLFRSYNKYIIKGETVNGAQSVGGLLHLTQVV